MSDGEDDYFSEKFLNPNSSYSEQVLTYAERRRQALRASELKNVQNRRRNRREITEESLREGLSKNLFEKAAENESTRKSDSGNSNKAINMMLKVIISILMLRKLSIFTAFRWAINLVNPLGSPRKTTKWLLLRPLGMRQRKLYQFNQVILLNPSVLKYGQVTSCCKACSAAKTPSLTFFRSTRGWKTQTKCLSGCRCQVGQISGEGIRGSSNARLVSRSRKSRIRRETC